MVFKFEFSDIFRVKTLKITWIVVPDEIKIEYSSNNSMWEVGKNWYRFKVFFFYFFLDIFITYFFDFFFDYFFAYFFA